MSDVQINNQSNPQVAALAKAANDTALAVNTIGVNIDYIKSDIGTIKQSMKEMNSLFVDNMEFSDYKKAVELRMTPLENQNALWRWLSPTLSAGMASAVTFLFINYLQHLK